MDVGKAALKEGFVKAFDKERETWVIDLERLRKWVGSFLKRSSGLVVVDGHYSPSLVPKNKVKKIFVLRCDPLVLRERLRLRGDPEKKILENVAAELLDACLLEALKKSPDKICELEATSKEASKLVEEALESLSSREGKYGKVDWIGKLSEEGKLGELLSSLSRGG